jgi:hypothetical protein
MNWQIDASAKKARGQLVLDVLCGDEFAGVLRGAGDVKIR